MDKLCNVDAWLSEIHDITVQLHLPGPDDQVLYDMDIVDYAILQKSKEDWMQEAMLKPKLDVYRNIKDDINSTSLVDSNLNRYKRSLLAKLICGILPLEVETARYDTPVPPREERYCRVCVKNLPENESHFIFDCEKLQEIRSNFYAENIEDIVDFMMKEDNEKIKCLLSPAMIKAFAKLVEKLFAQRRAILYQKNI